MSPRPLPARVLTLIRCTVCHNQLDLVMATDDFDHQVGPVLYLAGRHHGKPARDHPPTVATTQAGIPATRALVQRYLASLQP